MNQHDHGRDQGAGEVFVIATRAEAIAHGLLFEVPAGDVGWFVGGGSVWRCQWSGGCRGLVEVGFESDGIC
ncbi:hypothetical protein [Streptomyces sp. NPDC050145]|uniref:hypothetical protein n=1 Tax=Streptomyces sp. NPDC050145 TaxID=3365602 RepID=UPI0037990B34